MCRCARHMSPRGSRQAPFGLEDDRSMKRSSRVMKDSPSTRSFPQAPTSAALRSFTRACGADRRCRASATAGTERAVVYVCAHNNDHAFGLLLTHQGRWKASPRPACSRSLAVVLRHRGSTRPGALRRPGGAGTRLCAAHRRLHQQRVQHRGGPGGGADGHLPDVLEAMASEDRRPRHAFLALGLFPAGAPDSWSRRLRAECLADLRPG